MKLIVAELEARGFGHKHFFNDTLATPYIFLQHLKKCDTVRVYINGRVFLNGSLIDVKELMTLFPR
jgi:hypothetical protein